jgi:hypothetical protein
MCKMSDSKFEYDSLNQEGNQIRLIDLLPGKLDEPLSCSISSHSLGEGEVKYEALSYVWGDPEPVCPITLNGQSFLIARNLDCALRHVRLESEPRKLWVDGMSINQNDNQEKSIQVNRMHHIYQGADRVLAWLGPEANNSNLAIDGLKQIAAEVEGKDVHWDESARKKVRKALEQDGLLEALSALEERDFWLRGWVVQELTFGTDILFIAGNHSISWTVLNKATKAVMDSKRTPGEATKLQGAVASIWMLSNQIHFLKHSLSEDKKDTSILEHLRTFRFWQVSLDADRIAAFMNLPAGEPTSRLRINYDSPWERVFTNFAAWHMFQTDTLDVLSYAQCSVDGPTGLRVRYRNLGTWVPNWLAKRSIPQSLARDGIVDTPIYHASKDSKITMNPFSMSKHEAFRNSLFVQGYRFDRIRELGSVLVGEDPSTVQNRTLPAIFEWEAMMDRIDLDDNQYSKHPTDTSDIEYMTYATGILPDAGAEGIVQALNKHRVTESDPSEPGNPLEVPTSPETTTFEIGVAETFKLPRLDPRKLAVLEAFWRTLIADQWVKGGRRELYLPKTGEKSTQPGRADRAIWIQYSTWKDGVSQQQHRNVFVDPFFKLQFPIALLGGADGRRFMITEKGYMGLAPAGAREGDTIALVEGSQTPLVIGEAGRRWEIQSEPPRTILDWQYVGTSYVHGIMDGEAWEENDGKEMEMFCLN